MEKLMQKIFSIVLNSILFLLKKLDFYSPKDLKKSNKESKKLQKEFIMQYYLDENGRVKRSLTIDRNCPICEGNNSSVFFESFDGFRYVSCENCGMIYTTRYLIPDEYVKFQDRLEISEESWVNKRTFESDKKRFLKYIKFIKKYKKKGNLLDIGCYNGNFLEIANSSGYSVMGVEIHTKKASIAIKKGFNVIIGDIEKCVINQKFDIITMWEALEHTNNPNLVIEKIKDLLNPAGLFIFTVPNGSSINGRILTGHKMDFTGFGHKNLFTPSAVKYALKKNEFSILELFTLGNYLESEDINDYLLGNFSYTSSFHNWDHIKKHTSSSLSKGLLLLNLLLLESTIKRYNLGNILFVIAKKE